MRVECAEICSLGHARSLESRSAFSVLPSRRMILVTSCGAMALWPIVPLREQQREVRVRLDVIGLRCLSTSEYKLALDGLAAALATVPP